MLFTFDHVSVTGAGGPRLTDVTGSIQETGITAVVGPSGAGKSTLLRLGNRLELPDSGTVSFRGTNISDLDPRKLRRRVAMVFQRPTPFVGSVLENLWVAAPELTETAAADLLTRVGLDEQFLNRDAILLSAGEAQRVCLARALATQPEVVLMDEPTSALDPPARADLELWARALADSGVPLVWVTHDLAQMERMADQVMVMINGTIVHSASVAKRLADAPPAAHKFLSGSNQP